VLDVGTGSGCIAVTVAKRAPSASAVATDLSLEALDVARRNAQRHDVLPRVEFRHGDLFDAVGPGAPFDLILSNPPYVRTGDIGTLQPDVRDHEPRGALDGGPDGLTVIDRLVRGAVAYLRDGGWLMVEIGAGQGDRARQIVESSAGLQYDCTVADNDGVPRVVIARKAR
jgi:release factor glutamine methyltransferase